MGDLLLNELLVLLLDHIIIGSFEPEADVTIPISRAHYLFNGLKDILYRENIEQKCTVINFESSLSQFVLLYVDQTEFCKLIKAKANSVDIFNKIVKSDTVFHDNIESSQYTILHTFHFHIFGDLWDSLENLILCSLWAMIPANVAISDRFWLETNLKDIVDLCTKNVSSSADAKQKLWQFYQSKFESVPKTDAGYILVHILRGFSVQIYAVVDVFGARQIK